MDRIRSRVLGAACCLVLAGCAKTIDCPTVDKLNVGTSTLADAIGLLGKPTSQGAKDGSSILKWEATTHRNVGGGTATHVQLTFGPDGRLADKGCTTVITPQRVQEPAGG
jgi:hypothetical protein